MYLFQQSLLFVLGKIRDFHRRAECNPFLIDHFENGRNEFDKADIPLNLIPAFSDLIGQKLNYHFVMHTESLSSCPAYRTDGQGQYKTWRICILAFLRAEWELYRMNLYSLFKEYNRGTMLPLLSVSFSGRYQVAAQKKKINKSSGLRGITCMRAVDFQHDEEKNMIILRLLDLLFELWSYGGYWGYLTN